MKRFMTFMALCMPLYSTVSHAGIYATYDNDDLSYDEKTTILNSYVKRKQERHVLWLDQYKDLPGDKLEKIKELLMHSLEKTKTQATEALKTLEKNSEKEKKRYELKQQIQALKDKISAIQIPVSSPDLTSSTPSLETSYQQPLPEEEKKSLASQLTALELDLGFIAERDPLSFIEDSFYYLTHKEGSKSISKALIHIIRKLKWLEEVHKTIVSADAKPVLNPELETILSEAIASTVSTIVQSKIIESMNNLRSNPSIIAKISALIQQETNKKIASFLETFNMDIQQLLHSVSAIVDNKNSLEISQDEIYASQDLAKHIETLTAQKEKAEEKLASFNEISDINTAIERIQQSICVLNPSSSSSNSELDTSIEQSDNMSESFKILLSPYKKMLKVLKDLQKQKQILEEKKETTSRKITELTTHISGLKGIFDAWASLALETDFLRKYQSLKAERYTLDDPSLLQSKTEEALKTIQIQPEDTTFSLDLIPHLSVDNALEKTYGLERELLQYINNRTEIWEKRKLETVDKISYKLTHNQQK